MHQALTLSLFIMVIMVLWLACVHPRGFSCIVPNVTTASGVLLE